MASWLVFLVFGEQRVWRVGRRVDRELEVADLVGSGQRSVSELEHRLADHAADELHILVGAAGAKVQDLLRQGVRLTGLIGAVACLLWAIWLFLFEAKKVSWIWPSPFAQGCKKELEAPPPKRPQSALAAMPRCRASCSSSSMAQLAAGRAPRARHF